MKKKLGSHEQIRGQKRAVKVLNRKLKRNPSDHAKIDGKYSEWYDEYLKKLINE
jgi:hypothetical protein